MKIFEKQMQEDGEADKSTIDTKQIEYEIDQTIVVAFMETVKHMQENVGAKLTDLKVMSRADMAMRKRLEKIDAEAEEQRRLEEAKNNEDADEELDLVDSELKKMSNAGSKKSLGSDAKLSPSASRANLSEGKDSKDAKGLGRDPGSRSPRARPSRQGAIFKRQESIRGFAPTTNNLAPSPTMKYTDFGEKPKHLKHASVIDLKYAKERQRKEQYFHDKFYESILEIADELAITVDEQ